MRKILIGARKSMGFSQNDLAKKLNLSLRQYQRIESGSSLGKIIIWDILEDLLGIPQRQLRENTESNLERGS